LKKQIVKVGKLLYSKDLTAGTSGNISVRTGDTVLITGTGTALGLLEEQDVVEIDMDGNELEEGLKASSEKKMHLAIYKLRPDINAIIHCHSPFSTAFAACRKEIYEPIVAENILYIGKIPIAEYAMPSSLALVDNTVKYFKDYNIVLMANHGIVAASKDIMSAFFDLDITENYAKTYVYSKIISNPYCLSEEDVNDLNKLREENKKRL
jgi:L-fuculose-phosphate aldolase